MTTENKIPCHHHWVKAPMGESLIKMREYVEATHCSKCDINLQTHIKNTCKKLGVPYKFTGKVVDKRLAPGA